MDDGAGSFNQNGVLEPAIKKVISACAGLGELTQPQAAPPAKSDFPTLGDGGPEALQLLKTHLQNWDAYAAAQDKAARRAARLEDIRRRVAAAQAAADGKH